MKLSWECSELRTAIAVVTAAASVLTLATVGADAQQTGGTEPAPSAPEQSTLELQKATQNPVADLIRVPLQSNFNTWTVLGGGGVGRLIRLGKLPVSLQAQAFYNVVKPQDDPAPDWTLRPQVQFLFPK